MESCAASREMTVDHVTDVTVTAGPAAVAVAGC